MSIYQSPLSRDSAFELLRLVSMLMIVTGHFLIRLDIAGYFHPYVPTISNILLTGFYAIMVIGVNLFVMISGYFGIHLVIKPSLRLITDCIIYGIIAFGIRCMLFGPPNGFSLSLIGGGYLINYKKWWFVYSYLLLVLISPLIEFAIKQMEYRMMTKVVILLSVVTFYFGWLKGYDTNNGYNVFFFCYLYVLARYIRLSKGKKWNRIIQRYGVILFFLTVIVQVSLFLYVMKRPWADYRAFKIWGYNNPLIVFAAMNFFILFGKLQLKSSLVNLLAVGTFGIYLLHAGPAFGGIWENGGIMSLYRYYGILAIIGIVLSVYVSALIISLIIEFLKEECGFNKLLAKLSKEISIVSYRLIGFLSIT